MNRVSLAERIWYESSVPVFGEKFVLPVLATAVMAIVILNPMKWDWQSRLALFVGITAFAFLLSHQIHLRNEAIRTGTAPTPAQSNSPAARIEQNAKDSACSNVVGGRDVTMDCPADQKDHDGKKPSPKSP